MMRSARTLRLRTGAVALSLAVLAISCGSGSDYAGGGTGGTGISTGTITAFGSVVVNGVHFRTDGAVAPGFRTKKLFNGADHSSRADREVFAVGMVVTVRHGAADNDASEIDYRNNVTGPVSEIVSGTDNVVYVLGQTVVVDNAAAFAALKRNDVVEISGFADNVGRIVATSIFPSLPPNNEFQASGYVSGLSAANAEFRLGPLPGGAGSTVAVSYDAAAISTLAAGLADGMYVQVVTTDREPVNGVIAAARIARISARTEFPDGTAVDLEGLITTPWGGAPGELSFAVEGKRVQWDATTAFDGGTADDLRSGNRNVRVHGTETSGTVSAARVELR